MLLTSFEIQITKGLNIHYNSCLYIFITVALLQPLCFLCSVDRILFYRIFFLQKSGAKELSDGKSAQLGKRSCVVLHWLNIWTLVLIRV